MRRRRRFVSVIVAAVAAGLLGIAVPPSASGSCVGPILRVGPTVDDATPPTTGGVLQPGQVVTVTGEWFHSGCEDTYTTGPGCSGSPARPDDPEAPLPDVQLTLHQGSKTWVLGTENATGERYSISWRLELPATAKPGPAELHADSASLPVTIGS